MSIKRYPEFISEMKRYFSGEFSNLIDFVGYLKGKYRFMESVIEEFPEIKEDIKKISFYIEFPYKGETRKIKIKFGPWVKISKGSFAQWQGYLYTKDQRIVVSRKFFSPTFAQYPNYLAGVLLHEIVHSIDPKDRPFSGVKDDISIGVKNQAKRLGFRSGTAAAKEFYSEFSDYVIKNEIEEDNVYSKSPEEYDAWISQIVFELELHLLSLNDKEREEEIIKYLDEIRQGKYDAFSTISKIDRRERLDKFVQADEKFLKRLLGSIYRSIIDFNNLKRTKIKISVEIPQGVKERLESVLSEAEYEYIITGMESD
jgi:hypothetical protein